MRILPVGKVCPNANSNPIFDGLWGESVVKKKPNLIYCGQKNSVECFVTEETKKYYPFYEESSSYIDAIIRNNTKSKKKVSTPFWQELHNSKVEVMPKLIITEYYYNKYKKGELFYAAAEKVEKILRDAGLLKYIKCS